MPRSMKTETVVICFMRVAVFFSVCYIERKTGERGRNVTIRKLFIMLFVINGMEFLLGCVLLRGIWGSEAHQTDVVLFLAEGVILLGGLVTAGGLFFVSRYQYHSYGESMENLEKLNSRLREQRHDYLNQMQIVYGLLELEEYEDAREYLRPVFKDIMKVNKALKTSQPAVNALLQAKMEMAEKQGIDFYLDVGTRLNDLAMEPWELCKVLGNLIDNGMAAVSELEGERRISLDIRESGSGYCFVIRNNGPAIPEQHQKLIFNQGFTTRGEEGHGMGLFIVAAVLKEAGGRVEFVSSEEETAFTVTVPRKGEKVLTVPGAGAARK